MRYRQRLVVILTILQIIWPLNALSVYAQAIEPLTEDTGVDTPATNYLRDVQQPVPEISAAQLAALGESTIIYQPSSSSGSDQDINVNPWIDTRPTEDDYNQQTDGSEESTGRLRNLGVYRLASEANVAYQIEPGVLYQGEEDTADSVNTSYVSETEPSCDGDNPHLLCSPFQTTVRQLSDKLATIGAFEQRLAVNSGTGRAILFGEQCNPDEAIKPVDDVLVNGACDRTPRVDARLILLLDYLLRSKKDGGAGREYIELASLARFNEEPRAEDVTYIDGVSGKCVVDVNASADEPKGISTCLQIKAIDKIRVTTRVKKYGLFGTSTKYRYKAPIPIKVAWQSDEGQQQVPLPAISTQELLGNYGVESILELLQQEDFLSDPDFSGRPLQSLGLADITKFIGGRLLKQLMDGQNIANFNFGDTIEDFGVLALAGALNIDPQVLKGANSLQDIETAQGRSWVAEQIGLDKPLAGATSGEIFADVARQQIAKLLDIKPYVLESYQASELIARLGQGLIEMRLPVPEKSFTSNDLNEVKKATSNSRFALVFPSPSNATNEAQLAEIDEQLGVPVGSTANFVRNSDVVAYKNLVGQAVWANYFGKYSDNKAGGFAPEYPVTYLGRIATAADAQPIGDLTKVYEMTDPNNAGATITHPVGLTEADSAAVGTLNTRLSELHDQIGTVLNRVRSVISSFPNCGNLTYDTTRPVARCSAGYGYQEINLLDARQQALSRLPVEQFETELDNIMRRTDSFLAEASWNGEYVVLPSTGSQYYLSVTASLRQISDSLKRSRDHVANYRTYSGNSDGSSQRVDQLMNLPAGTANKLLSGGQDAQNALIGAGIRTVANYLPTTNDQSRFEMLATSAVQGTAATMVVTDSQKKYLAEVFLTASPNSEFRRIGRRILINNLSGSAQAESLGQTQFWSDISFYVDRYQSITNALNTLKTESGNLESQLSALPAAYLAQATQIKGAASSLFTLFNGVNTANLSLSGAQALVGDKREQFYTISNAANSLTSGLNQEENGVTGRIQSSINNVLTAARALEQSVMEILEGQPVTTQSSIPNSISIPEISLTDFQDGSVNSQRCSYSQRQISVLAMLYGDLNTSFRSSGQSTAAITGDALKKIFITMGSSKLAELMGLPMESFLYFSQVAEKTPDAFFTSVGRGQLLSQCENPNTKTDDELKELGRDYVIAHGLTALSSALGVNLPDWVNEDTIAQMMMGRVDQVLLAVGSNQVENLLDLPSGTITGLVKPEGVTETARQENRERTIINIVLSKLDVELDLPAGFTLTGNPTLSMGLARIESVLGLERGQLTIDEADNTAAKSISNAISNITTEAQNAKKSGRVANWVYANDAEIDARSQLIASLGMSLPMDVSSQLQTLDGARQTLDKAAADLSNSNVQTIQSDVAAKQEAIISTLTADNLGLFTNPHLLSGLEHDPNSGVDENARWEDANNRQAALARRLAYLDSRLGVTSGTTERWFTGEISTTNFAQQVGGGAAEQLGASAFMAFLDRLGADGPWVDAIRNRQVDERTGLSNLDLLKDVVLGRRELNGPVLAQVFQMMSQAMSFNFDEQAGFETGTIANIIANPAQADEIVFDQGVRIFAQKVLHFDIAGAADEGNVLKRLASAMIYGAAYNQETGRFEGVSFNGVTLNGGQAVLAGLNEFSQISQDWIRENIPAEEWGYFEVPITMLFDGVTGQIKELGAESNYIQLATSQNELRQRINAGGNVTDADRNRLSAMGNYNTTLAAIGRPDLPASGSTDNSIFNLASLDQFITQNRENSPVSSNLTADEQSYYEQGSAARYNSTTVAPSVDYQLPNGVSATTATDQEKTAANTQLKAADDRENGVRNAQAYWQNSTQRIVKATAYAAADYGLDKLFNLPRGVIKPGLAMTLFEGTTAQKTGLVVDIGINYLLNNVDIPSDLQFLLNYDNIRQATAFFLNQEGRGELLAQAFSAGGIFSNIQQAVFPRGLLGEFSLPQGTFGAMVGLLFNGNAGDFTVNGVAVKGLNNLFNGKWVAEVGFNYIGKLIGVDSAVMAETFRLGYDFYRAFQSWNQLASMGEGDLVAQFANTTGFTGDPVAAAKEKIAGAEAQMAAAAIAIGIYAINMLFGKAINKFEQALGLPPGTLMQGLSIALTAIFVGTGPMFFVTLGIFVLTTLLGFGFVKTVIRATADGYYPFAGELGDETTAGQKGIKYAQYPSADVMDDNGSVIVSRALGMFDPTNTSQKREGFMKAAQQKVKGVIMDSVNRTQLTKYFTAIGLLTDGTSASDKEDLLRLMRPNQIFVTQSQQEDGKLLYIDDLDVIKANRTYFNATSKDDNSGYCNKNHPAGICAGASGQFVETLQLSY
jgi:hypothetical protein